MSVARKLLGPALLLLGFLLALSSRPLGAQDVTGIDAGKNNICSFGGPTRLAVGQTGFYYFRVQDNEDDIFDNFFSDFGFRDTFAVSIDNQKGSDAKITMASQQKPDEFPNPFEFLLDNWVKVPPSNRVEHVDVESPNSIDPRLLDVFQRQYGYHLSGNPCGPSAAVVYQACLAEFNALTPGKTFCYKFADSTQAQRDAWAAAVDGAMTQADELLHDLGPNESLCQRIATIGQAALIDAGGTRAMAIGEPLAPGSNTFVGGINAYWLAVCNQTRPSLQIGPILDDAGFFAVTCNKPGSFDITVADVNDTPPQFRGSPEFPQDHLSSATISVLCQGVPTEKSSALAFPNSVEIYPAPGNLSHALVWVTLVGDTGLPAGPGYEVDFSVDRCSIETGGVDTGEKLLAAYNMFVRDPSGFPIFKYAPEIAREIETSPAASAPVDSDTKTDTVKAFDVQVNDSLVTQAGAILGCNTVDAPDATPGIATVTIIIEVPNATDVVLKVQVQVVGPPQQIVILAPTPATVRCGEKSAITLQVKDATGAGVSDNSRVVAVTNFGGVLAGTGAVAANAGQVTPISSTVASTTTIQQTDAEGQVSTFSGVVTFYLLTSEAHTGPYEVVVTSGAIAQDASPGFLTQPVSAQTSVVCTLPEGPPQQASVSPSQAPPGQAPGSLSPPSTGTGGSSIKPPNTGDAGLR